MLSLCLLKSAIRRAAAIVAVTLGTAGPASATFVVGDWDPAYGSPFGGLGWRGTSTTSVTASCLALGPVGFVANSLACPMSLVSAVVEFYDLSNPVPTVETLTFTGLTSVAGIHLDTSTGDLDGVILLPSFPVASTPALAPYGAGNVSFALEMIYTAGNSYAQLRWTGSVEDQELTSGVNVNPAKVRFSVPEPGSLLLASGALLLAGLARRRRIGR